MSSRSGRRKWPYHIDIATPRTEHCVCVKAMAAALSVLAPFSSASFRHRMNAQSDGLRLLRSSSDKWKPG